MKMKRVITALVLTIFIITSSAYAINISNAVYNSDTDTITLSGSLSKSGARTPHNVSNTETGNGEGK